MNFRDNAIKHAQSFSVNNSPPNIVNKSGWFLLVACIVFILSVFIWSIFGDINTEVIGQGIVVIENGKIFTLDGIKDNSTLKKINSPLGSLVKQGEILVELDQTELANQIKVSENYIATLKSEYDNLKNQEKEDVLVRELFYKEKEIMLNKVIKLETASIDFLDDLIKKQNDMLKKGYVNRFDYSKVLLDLTASKKALSGSNEELLEINNDRNRIKQNWIEKTRDLTLKIQSEEFRVNELKSSFFLAKEIKSPIDGIVIGILSSEGDSIKSGQPIMTLSTTGEGLGTIAYFLPENAKKIKKGMKALISPSNIKAEEYGSLVGEVVDVTAFPTSSNMMMAVLKNELLVKNLGQDQAKMMVNLRILPDPNNKTGYKWSSSNGPEEKITPGSIAQIKIVTRKQRPIYLLIPTVKKIFI